VLEARLQADGQVPQPDEEERDHDGAADELELIPEGRLEPGGEEGREEERDGREDGLLEREVLAPVGLDELVYAPVEARLEGHAAQALGVRVVGVEDRAAADEVAAVRALELRVVEGALLRVAQRAVGQRDEGELARRPLRPAVQVRVPLARQLPVSRLDLGPGSRPLDP
jgi:hypothetical protein